MNEAEFGIMVAELKPLAAEHDTVEEMFRAVIAKAKNHWIVLEDDDQFRGAVGSVLCALYDKGGREDDVARIEQELKLLRALSTATMPGMTLDLGSILDEEVKPIGLLKIWKEAEE